MTTTTPLSTLLPPLDGVEHDPVSGLPIAVCLLLWDESTQRLLCVTRRNRPVYGLVGGKVDVGETPIQALIREVEEESGVRLAAEELRLLYSGVCEKENANGRDFWTLTFVARRRAQHQPQEIEAGICPGWLSWEELERQGTFQVYNRKVQNAFEQQGL